jgi:hypothetical protein
VGLLVISPLAVVPAAIGAWRATRASLRGSWPGLLAGIGAASLFVAFVQRHGPGTVCWHTATASGCDQYLNPWPWPWAVEGVAPWAAAGVALVAASLVFRARTVTSWIPCPARPILPS